MIVNRQSQHNAVESFNFEQLPKKNVRSDGYQPVECLIVMKKRYLNTSSIILVSTETNLVQIVDISFIQSVSTNCSLFV